ncbi:hypothetical protein QUF70_16975 [Desulfobacterales bacterium HSG17]|nr:hypothetical protein [Desulfobacterales bacterium HSG17]
MGKEWPIFDNPKNVKRLLVVFFIVLGVVLLSGLWMDTSHAHFPWEKQPFFFAAYGFTAYVCLIFIAKFLRLFLKRDESYYTKETLSKSAEKEDA